MSGWAIGIDIGGTKIAGAIVSPGGETRGLRVVPTPSAEGGLRVLERVITLAVELLGSEAAAAAGEMAGIGVGTGGQVEVETGRLLGATALIPQWRGLDLKGALERATGLPAVVDNDAKAMAWAELRSGAAQGARAALFLTLGTGVGGAVAAGGRVLDGARGLAGHLGHMRVQMEVEGDEPLCSCGRRGCLEAYASGSAIREAGRRALAQSGDEIAAQQAVPDASAVWEAYGRGETWAAGVMAQARRALAHVLGGLVYAFNPDRVVIGGGLAAWGTAWCQEIEAALREEVDPLFLEGLAVVPAALGSQAGTVGAAYLAFEKLGVLGNPGENRRAPA